MDSFYNDVGHLLSSYYLESCKLVNIRCPPPHILYIARLVIIWLL